MEAIYETLQRFWSDLMSRPDGAMALRFILQPVVSSLLAVRDGLKDAKTGKPPYLYRLAIESGNRGNVLMEGLKATSKVIAMGFILDIIYQVKTFGSFRYPIETTTIVFVLAFLPYLLVRGAVRMIVVRLPRGTVER